MKEHKRNSESTTCNEVMHHICENLGEDLNSPKCEIIKKHLEDCNGCKSYFHSIDTTIKFYKDYNVNLSDDAHDKLLDVLGLKK